MDMKNSVRIKKSTSWITLAVLCLGVAALLLFGARDVLRDVYHEIHTSKQVASDPLPKPVDYNDIVNSTNQDDFSDTNVNTGEELTNTSAE